MFKFNHPARIFMVLGLSTLALASFGQSYPLQKTVKLTGPVLDRPFDRGLRIDLRKNPHPSEHENPKIPMAHGVGTNNLPVGTVQTFERSRPKIAFGGIGATGDDPPDCDMAVGPSNVLLVANTVFAVYDKKGKLLGQKSLQDFFTGVEESSFLSDPITFYDRTTQRYFVTILNVDFTNKVDLELIAVSTTSDPMGAWRKYALNTKTTISGADYWMDYPKFGYTKDAIAFDGNMFGFAGGYAGAEIVTMPKAGLLTGTLPTASFFNLPNLPTVELSRVFDPNQQTMYGLSASSTNSLTLIAVTTPATKPTVTTTEVTIPSQDPPNGDAVAPQGHFMDGFAGDGRLFHCEWRNGHLTSAHNINNPKTSAIEVRWYDILTGGYPAGAPKLVQSGNIPGDGGDDAFQPSASMNSKGDIGIVYSESSANLAPQMRFAARLGTDPLGSVGKPRVVAKSLAATYGFSGGNRWGDYFGIDVDPLDEKTFWCYGMVANADTTNPDWTTFVGSFNVDAFSQYTQASSVFALEGKNPTGNVASTYATDLNYFTVQSVDESALGQVASLVGSFTPGKTIGTIQDVRVDYVASAAYGDSLFVFLFNWSTYSWDHFSVSSLSPLDGSGSVQMTPAQFNTYKNPTTGELRVKLRAISPKHLGTSGTPFELKLNMIRVTVEAQ